LPGFHPIPDVLATWAHLDGCADAPPKETTVAADVTLVSFVCERVEVELYRVEGGGHSWPGSKFTAAIASIVGPTTMSINADDVMWAFFEQHPLPE
jgi:polyhydroxybutyrate depolymerase